MTTLSPTVVEAYKLLRKQIYEHIESAEYLALRENWPPEDQEALRQVIPDLLQAVRAVWHRHEPTWTGVCRCCSREWPCETARLIHREITDPDHHFSHIHANDR